MKFSVKQLLIAVAVCSLLFVAIVWLAAQVDLKIGSGTLDEIRQREAAKKLDPTTYAQ